MGSIPIDGLTPGAVNMTLLIVLIAIIVIGGIAAEFMEDDEDIVIIESVDGNDGNWHND